MMAAKQKPKAAAAVKAPKHETEARAARVRQVRLAVLPLAGYDIHKARQMETFVLDPVEGDQKAQNESEAVRLSMLRAVSGDMAKAGWLVAYVLEGEPVAE